MGGVKIQIVTVAILASVMAQANCEFYGIEFGKPSGISTNELTLYEADGCPCGRGEGEVWDRACLWR